VHSRITCILFLFLAITSSYCGMYDYRVKIPFSLDSFSTAEIPLRLIVLIAVVDSFRVIHLPSSGTKKRFV
jgi:hypothetical protein